MPENIIVCYLFLKKLKGIDILSSNATLPNNIKWFHYFFTDTSVQI